MHSYESVGLAAPQIGVPLRIFMIEFSEKMSEKFSPDIQKSREMAIIPLKVSWCGDIMSSFYHSNICSILLCLYEGHMSFTTRVIIMFKHNDEIFAAQC